jgi:hypothetical protein
VALQALPAPANSPYLILHTSHLVGYTRNVHDEGIDGRGNSSSVYGAQKGRYIYSLVYRLLLGKAWIL